MKTPQKTAYKEKAILVGVSLPDEPKQKHKEILNELERLSETAGAAIEGRVTQNRSRPDGKYYVGSGKADEIKEKIRETGANVVIFANDLSPAQVSNLEERLNVKVLDRSEIILDIFANHARTKEAKLQVELARLKYTLPRLKRMWTHLSRQEGGIGTRGPGERQIEMDRRLANRRIKELSEKLDEVQKNRQRQVEARAEEFTVSLVGYTNAGKSTLMNQLTGTDVEVEDQLFSTLSTKTKKWNIDSTDAVLLSDTVGFIREIPHHLIASFLSTLEETTHADLLLHVVDASHPNANDHIESVRDTLGQIEADDIPTFLLLNKQDRIEDPLEYKRLRSRYPDALEISAKTGEGIEELRRRVACKLDERRVEMELKIPVVEGKLLSMIHGKGRVLRSETVDETIEMKARLSPRYGSQIPKQYVEYSSNGVHTN